MRIIVTADTHYHANWSTVLESFVHDIAALKPDCFVLAGDVGEGLTGYKDMLGLLKVLDCPRLILTGNHDLWSQSGVRSEKLWMDVLPELTHEAGAIWLEGENWSQDGLGICGTNGWYDYSAQDPNIVGQDYAKLKPAAVADGLHINWPWSDLEFSNRLGEAFADRLAALETDDTIREVLAVTHVPPFEEGIARKPGNYAWNLNNAYFGNLTLGTRITPFRKVKRVISGHTHVGKQAMVMGAGGPIDMQVIAADYGKPVYMIVDYTGGA